MTPTPTTCDHCGRPLVRINERYWLCSLPCPAAGLVVAPDCDDKRARAEEWRALERAERALKVLGRP